MPQAWTCKKSDLKFPASVASIKLQCKNCSTNFPRYFFSTLIQSCVETSKTLVSEGTLINLGVYCIPKRPNEEPTISTICLCFYSKVIRKSSVQFSWEEMYVYIYLIFAEMYCKSKEHWKRLNKQKVIRKGYIKYVFNKNPFLQVVLRLWSV